jgi:hypothetical protein
MGRMGITKKIGRTSSKLNTIKGSIYTGCSLLSLSLSLSLSALLF